jgi:hypothetical protein
MSLLKSGCFFIIRSLFIILGIIGICSLPQLFFGTSPSSSTSLAIQPTPTLQFNFSNYHNFKLYYERESRRRKNQACSCLSIY